MKFVGFISLLALSLFIVLSCRREYSLENTLAGSSTGSIKTFNGDCMPSGSSGIFKKSVAVDSFNYIFVDINVITTGTYIIKSDTVNRISFKGEGFFETTGIHTDRLIASGTPFTNGTVPYSVKYGGKKCIVNVFTTD